MNRLKVLTAAAGFLLILKLPAAAQSPAEAEVIVEDSSAAASSAQDEGQGSQTSQSSIETYDSQALTETDWWAENDGLTFGYLPGGFGYGFGLGSCGGWSRSTGRGSAWWNAAGTSAWFPTGQQLPFPYGSGWCGNNGFGNRFANALQVNGIVTSTRHHPTWRRRPGAQTNNQTQARTAVAKAPRALGTERDGPDDDWTRVEDHFEYPHVQQVATLPREHAQAIRLRQHGRLGKSSGPQQAHAARMQGVTRAHLTQIRMSATMHMSGAHPTAHIAVRSGVRGHS